jgi:RND family efflux transporter MFP subunit
VIVLRRCEFEFKRSSLVGVAHMGATSMTILQDCLVRPGDRVKAGQVLGRVMDREIRAELELRTAEAENDIDGRVNEARYEEAMNKLRRTEALQKRVFVSTEELDGQKLATVTTRLEVEQSRYRRRLAELQRRQAEALVRAREYISPHDGVVVEVHKGQGEAVFVNDPIFRVVDVDLLKVSGYHNVNDYWRVHDGQAVRVSPEVDGDDLPIEHEVFTGRVVFVDRRIDPTSRTCKVVAEVPNRDLLLASGLEARMEIFLDRSPGGRRTTNLPKSASTPPRSERASGAVGADVPREQPDRTSVIEPVSKP